MAATPEPPFGDVSCRVTGYTIEQLRRMGLPTAHLTRGLTYTLDDLRCGSAAIPWDDYLVFLRNSHGELPADQFVELCTSYKGSPYLRPLLSAAGLWFHPAKYFEWVADPEGGAIRQLFRCVGTRFSRVGDREVVIEELVEPEFTRPPDIFWESQSIGFGALTTYFGLAPSVVDWEPIEGGAAFRIRLPRRRRIRFVLSWLASWFRRETAEDVRTALSYGHERSLRLEREITDRKRAEAALRLGEERLRRITDAVPGIVYRYRLDPDGRQGFEFVSAGAAALTGYTPDELVARPELIWERIDREDIPSLQDSIQVSARTGTPWQREFRFRTKDGHVRWVRGRSIPEPVTEPGRVVWNGILADVTAERRADEQLRSRDALLRKLSEQVPGVIYQYQQWPDGQSCFPYASQGIRDVYEVSPEQARESAAAVFDRLHPDDVGAVVASIRRSADTMEPWQCEYRVRLPRRGVRWLDGHAAPERLPDGGTIWHGYIRDVTDRKLAEEALRERTALLEAMLDSTPDGILVVGDTGRTVLENRRMTDIWKMPPEMAANPDDPERVRFATSRTKDPEAFQAKVSHLYAHPDEVSRDEFELVDGTVLDRFSAPVLDASGKNYGRIWMFRDVTERRRAEEALRASETRFRTFMEFSPILAWIVTPDGRMLFSNHGFARLLNMTPEAVERSAIRDIFPPEHAAEYLANNRRVLESGVAIETIEHAPREDGTEGEFLAYKFVVPTQDGSRQVGGVAVDVTERRQAEAALRESEERWKFALEGAEAGVLDWDIPSDRVRFSGRWRDLTGYQPGEFAESGDGLKGLIHPDDLPAAIRDLEATLAGRQTLHRVEHRLRRADGRWIWIESRSIVTARGPTGAPLRMIGTHTDITERKQVEQDLRESEERFRTYIDNAPTGLFVVGENGRYIDVNPAACLLSGYERDELLRMGVGDLTTPEARTGSRPTFDRIKNDGAIEADWLLRRKSGEVRRISIAGVRLSGNRAMAFVTDITERKRADEALAEARDAAERALAELRTASARAEQFYRLCEVAGQGIGIARLDGALVYMNPAFRRMLDLADGDEVTRRAFWDLVPAESHGFLSETVLTQTRETGVWSGEFDLLTMTGKRVPIINTVVLLRDPDGTVVGYSNIATDITERKRAEQALRESELRYRTLIETSSDAIFVVDLTGRILSANPAAERTHGYPMGELLSMRLQDLDLPDDAADLPDRMRRLRAGESLTFEVVHRRKDGTTFPVEVVASAVEIGGEWLVMAFDRDITERKQSLHSLEEAEHRQRLALNAAQMGTWDWDIERGRVNWDARQQELFGFAPGEYDGRPDTFFTRVHPADVELVRQRIAESLATGRDYEAEFRACPRPDRVRWLAGHGRVIYGGHGRPVRMVGVNSDLTDRKRAILAIEETERRHVLALNAGRMGTWDWEIGSDRLTWDDREQALFGYPPGAFDSRIDTFLARVHPEDQAAVRLVLAAAAAGRDFDGEFRIRLPSGEVRWIHGSGVVVPENDHSPRRLVGINYDITARKAAEAGLRESEERLRIFVESAPAGVAMLDKEVRYISYSRRWLTDYGLGDQNLVGRSHYEVFPDVTERWKEIHRRCLTGVSERCEQDRFDRADGSVDYLRWEIQPWTDATGAVGGLVFFTELITDRVKAEEQVRASLRDKEAMLKEIHHRVKNNLQVISSLLSLQAARVTHPVATDVLAESQTRVRAMALVHETLYRSDDLARVDLCRYLGELCGYLFRSYGVDSARVRLELDVEQVAVSLDKTIPCGLLVNEIVSNSLKYAFPDTRAGLITVRVRTRPDGHLTLTLADDGVGLPAEVVIDRTPSLGLQLVSILAEQLGGRVAVERSPGARYVISFAP